MYPHIRATSISRCPSSGHTRTKTPASPNRTPAARQIVAFSDRRWKPAVLVNVGDRYVSSVASASGSRAIEANDANIAVAPKLDRSRCPRGLRVASPHGNSARIHRKITSGISAKAERKKTIWPTAISAATALMQIDIPANRIPERIRSNIPVLGFSIIAFSGATMSHKLAVVRSGRRIISKSVYVAWNVRPSSQPSHRPKTPPAARTVLSRFPASLRQ